VALVDDPCSRDKNHAQTTHAHMNQPSYESAFRARRPLNWKNAKRLRRIILRVRIASGPRHRRTDALLRRASTPTSHIGHALPRVAAAAASVPRARERTYLEASPVASSGALTDAGPVERTTFACLIEVSPMRQPRSRASMIMSFGTVSDATRATL